MRREEEARREVGMLMAGGLFTPTLWGRMCRLRWGELHVYGLYDRDGEGALLAFEAGMMGSKISYKSAEMKTVPLLTACFYAWNVHTVQ